jgi:hypothetical protein
MANGRVQDAGTVDELLARQPVFRDMLKQPGTGSLGMLPPAVDLSAPAANQAPVSADPMLVTDAAAA